MADTKQATAETACEHCGHAIHEIGLNPAGRREKCWVHVDGHQRCDFVATPRTQPIQTGLRIPDDLKAMYDSCAVGGRHQLSGVTGWYVRELIERIARLEGGR